MAERQFTKIQITDKAERALRRGHPWVFDAEVTEIHGAYENGDLVDVYSRKDRFLGTGFINDNSKIRVRILSTNANDRFDRAFWERRHRHFRRARLPRKPLRAFSGGSIHGVLGRAEKTDAAL